MIRVDSLHIDLPGFSLRDVSLHVAPGEFFALMGPTGSGKTLVLESIAGLIRTSGGTISIGGRTVTNLPPEHRKVALVYQDHSLFPHLTVLGNVTFGQRYHGISRTKGRKTALQLLETLGLSDLAERKPGKLSGGEKQRVSLARALACSPDVVLLDEPLSSLDPQFRDGLRRTLKKLHQESGVTFLMVTHDFVDALTLAGRAAVIRKGRLEQEGAVSEIFRRPTTPFVADFVGMANVFPAVYGNNSCTFAGQTVEGLSELPDWQHGYAALRPEDVAVARKNDFPPDWCVFNGRVERVERAGFTWTAKIRCGEETFLALVDQRLVMDSGLAPDSPVAVGFPREFLHHMPDRQ